MAKSALPEGVEAPDFRLSSTPDQQVSLSDFKGEPIILAFYPADWSPVCGDQMALYNEILPEFRRHGARLLGISVDGPWCHRAFSEARHLHFPLLADFEPKGGVARAYQVYRSDGVCERALFVIDRDGVIRWSHVSPLGVNPGAEGILQALERLAAEQEAARSRAGRGLAGSAGPRRRVPVASASQRSGVVEDGRSEPIGGGRRRPVPTAEEEIAEARSPRRRRKRQPGRKGMRVPGRRRHP